MPINCHRLYPYVIFSRQTGKQNDFYIKNLTGNIIGHMEVCDTQTALVHLWNSIQNHDIK